MRHSKRIPSIRTFLPQLSALYVRQNRADKAMQRVNQAIAASPNNAGYYKVLAQLYLIQKNSPKAEEAFEKAVSLDAADFYQRIGLADFYVSTGNTAKGDQHSSGCAPSGPGQYGCKNAPRRDLPQEQRL